MRGHDPEQAVAGAEPTRRGSVASRAGTPVGAMVCAGTEGSWWPLEGTLGLEECQRLAWSS